MFPLTIILSKQKKSNLDYVYNWKFRCNWFLPKYWLLHLNLDVGQWHCRWWIAFCPLAGLLVLLYRNVPFAAVSWLVWSSRYSGQSCVIVYHDFMHPKSFQVNPEAYSGNKNVLSAQAYWGMFLHVSGWLFANDVSWLVKWKCWP